MATKTARIDAIRSKYPAPDEPHWFHQCSQRGLGDPRQEIASAIQSAFDEAAAIRSAGEARGGNVLASEQRQHDALMAEIETLGALRQAYDLAAPQPMPAIDGVPLPGLRSRDFEPEQPLTRSESYTDYLRARGVVRTDDERSELRLDVYLEGALTGEWRRGSEAEQRAFVEARAMSGAAGGAGGFMIPTLLWGQLIDLARARSVAFQAGAMLVPMESRTVDVARWSGDPTAAWRSENGTITPSDATLTKVTLTAQDLTALTVASRELIQDAPNVGAALQEAFVQSFALAVDKAALIGSGTAPEPRGIANTSGITTRSLGTNGASPTWGNFIDARGDVEDQNEQPTAIVSHPRTFRSLNKTVDSTGQYVARPGILTDLEDFRSTQLSTTLTQGTSTDTAQAIVGDFSKLMIGVRESVNVQPLVERYADTGQIGFVSHWRGDVAVARPKAFCLVTGIRP